MTDESPELTASRLELRNRSRMISGSGSEPPFAELRRVAEWCEQNDVDADNYGEGSQLQAFEQRVATMLGYPAARFMPSGTMAQQIAMRIWAERVETPVIGLHPTSHLFLHEERGYAELHGLDAVLVGDAARPMTADDLASTTESMAALIVELPTRENGGQLTDWDDLVALGEVARERDITMHLDGARLWEASAGYERPLEQICALFDSTYASFYKGIGALPGSILAGPEDFIADAAVWQRRHGGNLFTQMANWASADMRLDERIAKMPAYRDSAMEIAAALDHVSGLTLNPPTPQVNMFHVHLDGDKHALLRARDHVAESQGIWLFGGLDATNDPQTWKCEVTIEDCAMAMSLEDITAAFQALVES